MLKIFLRGLHYFFFIFSPVYFMVHLLLNLLGFANQVLFLILTLLITVTTFHSLVDEIDTLEISKVSNIFLSLGTLLMSVIALKVGIDDSTDTYFYHLNSTIPIALYHDLLNTRLYDLIGFSQGYPKFGEFLQAIFVELTNHFWSYGLASVLVIPASYTVTYLLARKLGLNQAYADLVGLAYAFNPINIAQATTGYVDSTFSLYILGASLLVLQAVNFPRLVLLLINLVALLNIKFTGIPSSLILFLASIIWHRKRIIQSRQIMSYLLVSIAIYFIGGTHYFTNLIKFGTFIFPYLDWSLAQITLNSHEVSKWEKLINLFWSLPQPFAQIAKYDVTLGAFSFLWYPMPFFILLAVLKAIRVKDQAFLGVQGLFWLLLLLDPTTSWGRYVAYFQFAGIIAIFYLLKEHSQRATVFILTILPVAYISLGGYILFNPELGLVTRRLAYYEQNRVLLASIDSTMRKAFSYYYDVNSFCTGYYWLLKFKQLEVKLTQNQPTVDNYFYIHRKDGQCAVAIHHNLKTTTHAYSTHDTQYLDITVTSPFALEYCKQCVSEYGCSYVPFYVHQYTQDLSHSFPFEKAGEKELTLECLSLDGNLIKEQFKFQGGGK